MPAASHGPLAGVKVVACSTAQAGTVPYMLMADLGAEVIKIEVPEGGDTSRGNSVLPSFLGPVDKQFTTVTVADIAAAVAALLRGEPWQGRRTIGISSFDASPADVAQAFSKIEGKAVAPVFVPHEQWAGILGGNGFSIYCPAAQNLRV